MTVRTRLAAALVAGVALVGVTSTAAYAWAWSTGDPTGDVRGGSPAPTTAERNTADITQVLANDNDGYNRVTVKVKQYVAREGLETRVTFYNYKAAADGGCVSGAYQCHYVNPVLLVVCYYPDGSHTAYYQRPGGAKHVASHSRRLAYYEQSGAVPSAFLGYTADHIDVKTRVYHDGTYAWDWKYRSF